MRTASHITAAPSAAVARSSRPSDWWFAGMRPVDRASIVGGSVARSMAPKCGSFGDTCRELSQRNPKLHDARLKPE